VNKGFMAAAAAVVAVVVAGCAPALPGRPVPAQTAFAPAPCPGDLVKALDGSPDVLSHQVSCPSGRVSGTVRLAAAGMDDGPGLVGPVLRVFAASKMDGAVVLAVQFTTADASALSAKAASASLPQQPTFDQLRAWAANG